MNSKTLGYFVGVGCYAFVSVFMFSVFRSNDYGVGAYLMGANILSSLIWWGILQGF